MPLLDMGWKAVFDSIVKADAHAYNEHKDWGYATPQNLILRSQASSSNPAMTRALDRLGISATHGMDLEKDVENAYRDADTDNRKQQITHEYPMCQPRSFMRQPPPLTWQELGNF